MEVLSAQEALLRGQLPAAVAAAAKAERSLDSIHGQAGAYSCLLQLGEHCVVVTPSCHLQVLTFCRE